MKTVLSDALAYIKKIIGMYTVTGLSHSTIHRIFATSNLYRSIQMIVTTQLQEMYEIYT